MCSCCKAEWVDGDHLVGYYCSYCDKSVEISKLYLEPYCPNCGKR